MKCVRHPAPGVITTTEMDNHPETGDVLVVVDTCPTCQKQSRHLLAEHMEHWIMAGVKCSGLVVSGYVTVQAVPIVKYTVAVDRPYVQKLPAPKMGGQNYCVVWPDTKPGESELIQLDPRVATPGGVALILTPVPMFDECSNHRIHLCQIGD